MSASDAMDISSCARVPQHLAREETRESGVRCARLQGDDADVIHRLKRPCRLDGDHPRIVEMIREVGGRVAGALPAAERVGGHRPDLRIVALQPLYRDTRGSFVEPHPRERLECRCTYLHAGVTRPAAEDGPRSGGATDAKRVRAVEAVCGVDDLR